MSDANAFNEVSVQNNEKKTKNLARLKLISKCKLGKKNFK